VIGVYSWDFVGLQAADAGTQVAALPLKRGARPGVENQFVDVCHYLTVRDCVPRTAKIVE
jgi:hypothetical protein